MTKQLEDWKSGHDLPLDVCKTIGTYFFKLHASMPPHERHKLVEFAPKLRGSAASVDIEVRRAQYLMVHAGRYACVAIHRLLKNDDLANRIEASRSIEKVNNTCPDAYARECVVIVIDAARLSASKEKQFDWDPYLSALGGALVVNSPDHPIFAT